MSLCSMFLNVRPFVFMQSMFNSVRLPKGILQDITCAEMLNQGFFHHAISHANTAYAVLNTSWIVIEEMKHITNQPVSLLCGFINKAMLLWGWLISFDVRIIITKWRQYGYPHLSSLEEDRPEQGSPLENSFTLYTHSDICMFCFIEWDFNKTKYKWLHKVPSRYD